jgi:hypothetical protein
MNTSEPRSGERILDVRVDEHTVAADLYPSGHTRPDVKRAVPYESFEEDDSDSKDEFGRVAETSRAVA